LIGRRILRFVGWGSVVLVLLVGTGVLVLHLESARRLRRAQASFAREVMPLVRVDSCPYARSDPRNGAYWYLAAARSIRAEAPENVAFGKVKLVRQPPGTWSAVVVQRVTSVLAAQQKALGWAYAGALRPMCDVLPYLEVSRDEDLPSSLFRLSKLLLAEAGLALRQGNQERAASAAGALEALGLGLQSGPTILEEMVGTQVIGSYLRALNWIVESDVPSVATLEALRARLPRVSAHEVLARVLANEGSSFFIPFEHAGLGRGIVEGLSDFCGDPRRTIWRDHFATSQLEEYRHRVAWSSLTHRQLEQAVSKERDNDVWMGVDAPSLIGKCQAVESSLQLAAIALDLRIGAAVSGDLPAHLPAAQADLVDPFAGEHPVYSKAAWGAQVSNPAAAVQYSELTRAMAPPFAWKLPTAAHQPPG
jgi:hypothetical protein